MRKVFLFATIVAATALQSNAQQASPNSGDQVADTSILSPLLAEWPDLSEDVDTNLPKFRDVPQVWGEYVYRGQDSGGAAAGAAAATDPSAILTQLQIQNVFVPESYEASGYKNSFIIQPVLPFPVAMPIIGDYFPNHILRPTLPIISPTADPDGPAGVEGGLGDMTILDAYVHNIEGFGTLIMGYTAILPTATHSQLGLREWQLGPAAGLLYKEIPKTLVGFIYQQPFSLQGDAQQILLQPILVRHLEDDWYVRWGDMNWEFDTRTGNYNLPLNFAVGKVTELGRHKANVFVQPFYTPEGLRRDPAEQWGVKLNITFLFPDKKFGPLFGHMFDRCDGHCCCE
jgi:hypothetical protein